MYRTCFDSCRSFANKYSCEHFSVIVAPVQTTPSALQGLNLEALFRLDLDEAVQQVLDFDNANREKASQGFTVWLEEKRRIAGEAKQQLVSISSHHTYIHSFVKNYVILVVSFHSYD